MITTRIRVCKLINWTYLSSQRAFSTRLKTEIKGQTISYVKVGNGPKNILCFPGFLGTNWSDFKPQIEGLDRDKFTTVAWDPPGYGFSRPPNRVFNATFFENDADFANNLMQSIGINKFSLLGWSDGGISSLILAAKYPQNVENLIIWGANAYVTAHDLEAIEKTRDISKWSDRMYESLVELYTEKGLQKMWEDWFNTFVEMFKNDGDICRDCLRNIQCPTFILHGDQDPFIPFEHVQYLLDNVQNSVLHRYAEGKHNIHLHYANDFNERVSKFILSNHQ